MTRWCAAACAAALLLAVEARAEPSIDGVGRISVVAGYRWVPNWFFLGRAAEAGYPLERASPGGIQGAASFGFGVSEFFEATIDLFGGFEGWTLSGLQPFTSVTYGLLLGGRLTRNDVFFQGFAPYVGVQLGPTLALISTASFVTTEASLLGTSFNGGATWHLNERFGLTLDVRWLIARYVVPTISGANVGGLFASLGVTVFFPAAPTRKDLPVPGF